MLRGLTGHYLPISTTGETARAFVPRALPPDPLLEIDGELGALLDAASTALGRLDSHLIVATRSWAFSLQLCQKRGRAFFPDRGDSIFFLRSPQP